MKHIQEAVRGWLELVTGVRTVADRSRVRGEYPLLAVSVQEDGTVLIDGGRQAEHTYQVTVAAAGDRERDGNMNLLSGLVPVLLRGIPVEIPVKVSGGMGQPLAESGGNSVCERRVLHPLGIQTEAGTLTFSLVLCVPIPPLPKPGDSEPGVMETLHLGI